MMDRGGDQLALDRRLLQASDAASPLVHFNSTQPSPDHLLANHLQRQRAEVLGQSVTVQLPGRTDGKPNAIRLCRRLAVFDVVTVGELEISRQEFVDGKVRPAQEGDRRPVDQPFRKHAVELGLALWRSISAGVRVPSVKRGQGLARRLIVTVTRGARMLGIPGPISNPVDYRLLWRFWPLFPGWGRYPKSWIRRELRRMGRAGIEPATPGFSVLCSTS